MKTSFLVIVFNFLFAFIAVSQTWPKIYTVPSNYSDASCACETYDSGIGLLSKYIGAGGYVLAGWFLKTDVNGEVIWERTLGNITEYYSWYKMMQPTSDSGFIITFSTHYAEEDPHGYKGDAGYMKLNACGELDWCRIISDPGIDNFAQDVIEVSDGYIGLFANYRNGSPPTYENPNTLIKLGFDGHIQWMYNYDNALFNREELLSLRLLNNNTILATGYGEYKLDAPDCCIKPVSVNIDLNGSLIEYKILHYGIDSLRYTYDQFSIQALNGTIYSSGQTAGLSSIRTHHLTDSIQQFYNLNDGDEGNANCLAWMQDSTIVISETDIYYPPPTYDWQVNVKIIDTLGNILFSRALFESLIGPGYYVSTTHDNKILATGSAEENPYGPMLQTYLFKLTSTLEDDVYDPTPRVYDYACPGGVAPHDTIGMEQCDIVVSAAHLASLPDIAVMEVYPNPVNDVFQVRLPEFIAIRNNNKGLNTALYQSNYQQQSTLQVFNLSGRFISEQKLTQGQLVAQFDASRWVPGMYLLRLVYKDKTVGSAKVVR